MKFIRKLIPQKTPPKEHSDLSKHIKKIVGFRPANISLYLEAFIHSSLNHFDANTGQRVNFERLEFLGDAMLNAIVASYFYEKVPYKDEGYLTQMRSKIVSRSFLNKLGKKLELIKFAKSSTRKSMFGDDIHGNLFEALVGAVYLDKGFIACEKFVRNILFSDVNDLMELEGKVNSYKSLLINHLHRSKKTFEYKLYQVSEKNHKKQFGVKLVIEGKVIAEGEAFSKKKAEEIASEKAYELLKKNIEL